MDLKFIPETHTYQSTNPEENISWLSVTKFVSMFKKEFNAPDIALKVSKNKKSKWYGLTPEDIQKIWSAESNRALTLGNWYHNQREMDLLSHETIKLNGIDLPIIKPTIRDDIKYSPEQKLISGIYPEHFIYLKSIGICGQADRVDVYNKTVDILDYKTNKEIKLESYKDYRGISQKMNSPIDHLDDCNYYHYAMQMSIYMFIILRHNLNLNPGKIILNHIIFESDGFDGYGNPISLLDKQGEPIVKEIVPYKMPYLKKEVKDCIDFYIERKLNKQL